MEPSRVFADSDFRGNSRYPLMQLDLENGDTWFGPNHPSWMFLFESAENKTLSRAIDSWGTWTPPPTQQAAFRAHLEDLLMGETLGEAVFEEPTLYTLPNGTMVPAFDDGQVPGYIIPATPVYYATRRYGDGGRWLVLASKPVVRYVVELRPVAVVGATQKQEAAVDGSTNELLAG